MPAPISRSADGTNRFRPTWPCSRSSVPEGRRARPRCAGSLDEALANLRGRAWPVPILRYFRGDLDEAALLRAAAGDRHQTEAHAFLGLDRLQAGDRTAACPTCPGYANTAPGFDRDRRGPRGARDGSRRVLRAANFSSALHSHRCG